MPISRYFITLLASLLMALGLVCTPVLADGKHRDDNERNQGAEGRALISLDDAVRRAERRFNARVVKAETRTIDGRVVHVLRLVSDDGRVFTVRVDAQSGNMN
jgi:uncharacterized membrane protein YkoI